MPQAAAAIAGSVIAKIIGGTILAKALGALVAIGIGTLFSKKPKKTKRQPGKQSRARVAAEF